MALWLRGGWDSPDGVPAQSWGLPSLFPSFWLKTFGLGSSFAKTEFEKTKTAPLLCVVASEKDDRPAWIKAGFAMQLIALTASSLGLDCSLENYPLRNPQFRRSCGQLPSRKAILRQS